MNTRFRVLTLAALAACVFTSSALAQSRDARTAADRKTFDRLTTEYHQLEFEIRRQQQVAALEAHVSGSKPHDDTRARLISLQDQRDLVRERLAVLSTRHGWAITEPSEGAEPENPDEFVERVFARADHMVLPVFEREALEIAAMVDLPRTAMPVAP